MSFYQKHLMPKVVSFACASGQMKKVRSKTIPMATGDVLEIGFGSGHNLPFYQASQIKRFYALEPDAGMRKLAEERMGEADFACEVLDLQAEAIPLETASIDTLVMTFTLCTIPDVKRALDEMRRVVKPGGRLIFAEHGLSPDEKVAKWQNRIEPIWKPLGGGCHLTRKPVSLIADNGFEVQEVTADYLPKSPKFAGFVSFGNAKPV